MVCEDKVFQEGSSEQTCQSKMKTKNEPQDFGRSLKVIVDPGKNDFREAMGENKRRIRYRKCRKLI